VGKKLQRFVIFILHLPVRFWKRQVWFSNKTHLTWPNTRITNNVSWPTFKYRKNLLKAISFLKTNGSNNSNRSFRIKLHKNYQNNRASQNLKNKSSVANMLFSTVLHGRANKSFKNLICFNPGSETGNHALPIMLGPDDLLSDPLRVMPFNCSQFRAIIR